MQPPTPMTEAVRNCRLLEGEITRALRREGWHITTNAIGDHYAGGNRRKLNITKLAQALSPRVLVKVTGDVDGLMNNNSEKS